MRVRRVSLKLSTMLCLQCKENAVVFFAFGAFKHQHVVYISDFFLPAALQLDLSYNDELAKPGKILDPG